MSFSRLGSRLCQGHRCRWCGTLPSFLLFLLPVVPVEVSCKLQAIKEEMRRHWCGRAGEQGGQHPRTLLTSGSMSSARGADEFWGDKH